MPCRSLPSRRTPARNLGEVQGLEAQEVYFLHDDRLGAPQVATDSYQNGVWSANYGPFGELSTVPGLIVQNLRLPGQEFDVDAGLYHNGFRDYVPGWGRYLQSDPIGLVGGLNTYGYAEGNPVNSVDPLGLCSVSASDDTFTITFESGATLTIPVQQWQTVTSAQQVALLSEAILASDAVSEEPSLLQWLFQYLSGLIAKPEPPQDDLGGGGGPGIRG
jgi:RHS repeat-associated protein